MTSALTYFITAFVITTSTPSSGWVQYTQAFRSEEHTSELQSH